MKLKALPFLLIATRVAALMVGCGGDGYEFDPKLASAHRQNLPQGRRRALSAPARDQPVRQHQNSSWADENGEYINGTYIRKTQYCTAYRKRPGRRRNPFRPKRWMMDEETCR
jgi:hypothetical protein